MITFRLIQVLYQSDYKFLLSVALSIHCSTSLKSERLCHDNILQSLVARGSPNVVDIACSWDNLIVIPSDMTDNCSPGTIQSTNSQRTSELEILFSVLTPSIDTFWKYKESTVIKTSIISVNACKKI